MEFGTGDVYEGEWQSEKMHGNGRYKFGENGDWCDGDFVNDKMQGKASGGN